MGVYYNICRITGLLIKTELVTSKIQELEKQGDVETEDLWVARQDNYFHGSPGYTIFYFKYNREDFSYVRASDDFILCDDQTKDGNLSSFVMIEDQVDYEEEFTEMLDELDPSLASIVREHAQHVQCIFTYYS